MPGKVDCCPKCQAESVVEGSWWSCRSVISEGEFKQSDKCHISQLEAENNQLRTVALTQSKDTSLEAAEVMLELKREIGSLRDRCAEEYDTAGNVVPTAWAWKQLNRANERLHEEILRLKGEVSNIWVSIRNGQITDCVECGTGVKVDEGGLCVSCGADAMVYCYRSEEIPGGDSAEEILALKNGMFMWQEAAINESQRAVKAEVQLSALQGVVRAIANDPKYGNDSAWVRANLHAALSRASLPAPSPGEDKWPTVAAFAHIMRKKLDKNKHRSGWESKSVPWLMKRMREEMVELTAAVRTGDKEAVGREAADVANFGMMVTDNMGGLSASPPRDRCGGLGGNGGDDVCAECEGSGVSTASSPWVSVEDRLPDDSKIVRAIDDDTGEKELLYRMSGNWYHHDSDGLWLPDVTHWMPIPPCADSNGHE